VSRLRILLGTLKARVLGRPLQKGARAAREEFWELATSMTPYVAAPNEEAVFVVPTEGGGRSVFVSGARKSEFVGLARACAILEQEGRLHEPRTIVDVGAHIGTTTVPALTRHGFARAVAIEPDPDNVRLLRANIALNGLTEQVTVVAAALSGTSGERLHWSPGRDRGSWVSGKAVDEATATTTVVETVTLDGLAEAGVVDPAATGLLWFGQMFDESAFGASSVFFEHHVPIVFVFRRNELTESSPFLHRLRENGYERIVDLRQPSLDEPVSAWTPPVKPLDELVAHSPRKKITDMLVY
jgi:FkbM family methyltransferase